MSFLLTDSTAPVVGDQVRVTRKVATAHPNGMGLGRQWYDAWCEPMDEAIDGIFTIQEIDLKHGVSFTRQGEELHGGFNYPFAALVRVTH